MTIRSFLLVIVGVALFYCAGVVVRERYGISVVVRNVGGDTVHQVRVNVLSSGSTYVLGDLSPGERKQVFVRPTTESHIYLEFFDPSGTVHAETVIGYAEDGYCGKASVTIVPTNRVESQDKSHGYPCWESWWGFI